MSPCVQSIAGLDYTAIIGMIKDAGRPLRLTFLDPEQGAEQPEEEDDDDAEEAAMRAEMNAMVQAQAAQPTEPAAAEPAAGGGGEEAEEEDEEMEDMREEYVMGIMSNCQSCLDPISGERMLVADLSYTVRRLTVAERFNLRNENELSDSAEDNQLFERRSSTTLAERSLSGSTGGFGRAGEEGSSTKDGATVLLTGSAEFSHVVVLGAPACGKTTLLQKMRYWAAISAYQEPDKFPIPVFVYLVGFAKFVMNGGACDLLAYLESSSPPDQYKVIAQAHADRTSLYLLDGLDECASVKGQLQEYIGTTLAAETDRIVLSSRLAGFSDDQLAERYEFVQLELCSVEIQKTTARRRLPEKDYARFEEMMSRNPMFALYATTPLSLSLLIELFRYDKLVNPKDEQGRQRTMNKGEIYRAGMLHMMDVGARLQKYTTDECANSFIEANDFPRLDYSYNEEVWNFFATLAMDLHERGTRNFKVKDVRRLGFGELWTRLFPYLRAYIMPMFNRLDYELEAVDVQREEAAAIQPNFSARQAELDGDHRYTWRFIHLTFQEFFVAQGLLGLLEDKLKRKNYFTYTTDIVNGVLKGKLYDSWYREAILLMASCAPDTILSAIVDFLMAQQDNDVRPGVNEHLVMVMLDERRGHPLHDTIFRKVRQQQQQRMLQGVVAALGHPFSRLRTDAIAQLQKLGLDVSRIADRVVSALTDTHTTEPWFRLQALMESLVELRRDGGPNKALQEQDTALAEAIKDSLLGHHDLDVVSAAARALGALGVRNGRLIFALYDVLDQGHSRIIGDVAHAAARLGVSWGDIATHLQQRMSTAQEGGAGGAVFRESTDVSELMGSTDLAGHRSPDSKLAAFAATDNSVHKTGDTVEVEDVNQIWIEVARTLGGAGVVGGEGGENVEQVMESLREVMMHESREVAVEGAKAFGSVGLEHFVLDWSFEQLEEANPAPQRRRGVECLTAMAEAFPNINCIQAFCGFVKDSDEEVAKLAAAALPKVAKTLNENEAVIEALMGLMRETTDIPGRHLLAAEALVAIPGSGGMCAEESVEALGGFLHGDDWETGRRAAKCLTCMIPDQMADGLTGWLSGDHEKMPPVASGAASPVDVKEVRLEACTLLACIPASCDCYETVQAELLKNMQACTKVLAEVDVAVAALEAIGSSRAEGGSGSAEFTEAVIVLLKMEAKDFEAGLDVEDRIMVAQTAALTALSSLAPSPGLAEHLNNFLLSERGSNPRTGSDLLWEPAASALQACRRANPDDESVAAALQASHEVSRAPFMHSTRVWTHAPVVQALEWVLKSKASSRSMVGHPPRHALRARTATF